MKLKAILFCSAVVAVVPWAHSQSAATPPAGYVTVSIAGAFSPTAYTITPLFAPLHAVTSITGQNVGKITGVTSNTISNSAAGWDANALSAPATPYFVKLNSGTAIGRMFLITANTATQLTVNTEGLDLTASVASGDVYDIVPGDTLVSIFGSPAEGIVGGTFAQFNASETDKILINNSTGAAVFYYFDTSVSQWRRAGSSSNQGNLVISPKAGMFYYRIGSASLNISFLGRVPDTSSQRQIPATGTTILAPYYPVDITLVNLGIHTMTGWRKLNSPGVTLNDTDRLVVKNSAGAMISYYHDGTSWKRVGSGSNQDATVVSVGSAIYCTRFGTVGQSDTWTQALPYSLQP